MSITFCRSVQFLAIETTGYPALDVFNTRVVGVMGGAAQRSYH